MRAFQHQQRLQFHGSELAGEAKQILLQNGIKLASDQARALIQGDDGKEL
jgi:hypothetical protein